MSISAESLLGYYMSYLEAFISASITKELLAGFFVFQKLILVRLLVGEVNEVLSRLNRSLTSEI